MSRAGNPTPLDRHIPGARPAFQTPRRAFCWRNFRAYRLTYVNAATSFGCHNVLASRGGSMDGMDSIERAFLSLAFLSFLVLVAGVAASAML